MTTRNRSARRALGAALIVLVAAATLSLTPATAGAVGSGNDALLVSANAFIRNSYSEVGARPNGSFGSNIVQPAGWHGNYVPRRGNTPVAPGLAAVGFRVDRDKDGWGTGRDDGDFFVPGGPYEGWSVQAAGATRFNNVFSTGVVGSYVSSDTTGDPSVAWDSADTSSGVGVRLVQSVPADGDQQLNVDVTLTNPTSAPVDALFGKAVDPDNCQQYANVAAAICDYNGDGSPDPGPDPEAFAFRTHNKVLSQRLAGGATSAVSASQADGSDLTLWSADPDALAATYAEPGGPGGGGNFCDEAELSDIYASGPALATASPGTIACGSDPDSLIITRPGDQSFDDSAMTLVVKKTVPANSSVTFRVSYSFSTAAYLAATAALVDLTEGPLDTMTVGTPYTYDLSATGIAVPTYAVTAGTLPDGLALDAATGAISGTPTTAGLYDFSVTASGTEGSVTKQYTGEILAAPGVPPTWTSSTLPDPVKGQAFSSGVTATADGNAPGTGAITYEIQGDASTLPDGLTLNPTTGAVTGTPTAGGPYDFTIVATNEFGFVTQQFTGTIGVPPTWTDNVLGTPTATRPYAEQVAAAGTGPITYTVTAGRLPAGLTLNPTTGAVTGTPTTPGGALFIITATNTYGSIAQGFGFNVAPRPRTSASGTVFFVGTTTRPTADGKRVLARLAAAAPRGATNVKVTVEGWAEFKRGPLPAVVRLARNRTAFVTRDLQKRRLWASYSGTTGGRYPVPGPTGRRAEVTVSWDTPS
jgi:hypothetical protein